MGSPPASVKGLSAAIRLAHPIRLELTLDVAPGEVLALVGPSGAGKSTALRALAGMVKGVDGRIVCNGSVWLDSAAGIWRHPRRRRIGFVFQSFALFPHLTALANVMEAMTDLPRAERRAAAQGLLERVRLGTLAGRRPAALSGGQQQRVGVARALARRPDLLLLDEPFGAVDRDTRHSLQRELAGLRRHLHMPVIIVTHDLDEVAALADRVVLLREGQVAAAGPTGEILAGIGFGPSAEGIGPGALLSATVIGSDPAKGLTLLAHPAGTLHVPVIPDPPGARVRVVVHSRDVALAVGDPGRISIRNRLVGTVVDIRQESMAAVEVRLDLHGEPLVARITADAVRDLGLTVGCPATALIKAVALHPAPIGSQAPG